MRPHQSKKAEGSSNGRMVESGGLLFGSVQPFLGLFGAGHGRDGGVVQSGHNRDLPTALGLVIEHGGAMNSPRRVFPGSADRELPSLLVEMGMP